MRRWRAISLVLLAVLTTALAMAGPALAQDAAKAAVKASEGGSFEYFAFHNDASYTTMERVSLWLVLIVAMLGLGYAGMLVGQVVGADQGTERMRDVAAAIRQGANAYLVRQFKAIVGLVFLLTAIVYFTAESTSAIAMGRAAAFFMGATFSDGQFVE